MNRIILTLTAIVISVCGFSQEKTYKVGDLYENGDVKGVVFEVNESGTRGKIISIDETSAPWVAFVGAVYVQVGISQEEADGSKNMKIIMNASGWRETYTAAYWCYKHGEKWYLPSTSELQLIFKNKDILNQTLASIEDADKVYNLPKGSEVYLSSNEVNNIFYYTHILAVNKKGGVKKYGKNMTGRVRAVCKF